MLEAHGVTIIVLKKRTRRLEFKSSARLVVSYFRANALVRDIRIYLLVRQPV